MRRRGRGALIGAASLVTAVASLVPASAGRAAPADAQWPTYHRDNARSGFVATGPRPSSLRQQWASAPLGEDAYAEPLVVNGLVVVATEADTVAAFDATTGRRRWLRRLGTPVNGGSLPCGNIDPSGITSTPVADPDRGVLYVVTLTGPPHHTLVSLDLATGKVRDRVTVDPPGADRSVQQQRSALTLVDGQVVVPFGGLFGDCGDFHGYLVGVSTTDLHAPPHVFQVPGGVGAGIWAPSGASTVGNDVLVATGNTTRSSGSGQDLSNSVIRLSRDLTVVDSFTASDQGRLNRGDIDLGTVAPVPVTGGFVFQGSKAGPGYLLRDSALGGVGGQLAATQVCDGGAYGGTATAGRRVFVACTDGLAAVQVDGEQLSVAWRSEEFGAGPPIVTGDTVWALDLDEGKLRAFSAADGRALVAKDVGDLPHFATPTAAGGRIYVVGGQRLRAFGSRRSG